MILLNNLSARITKNNNINPIIFLKIEKITLVFYLNYL